MTKTMQYRNDNSMEEKCEYIDHFQLILGENCYEVSICFCNVGDSSKRLVYNDFLHKNEIEYLESLLFESRINSYLLGRYTAKKAISKLTDEGCLNEIIIRNGVFNQPVVICDSFSNVQVSITHCDEFAASIAFDDMLKLGIDLEKYGVELNLGIESELTQHEKELINRVNCSYSCFVLMVWSIKESLSKALKTGLTVPLSVLEVQSIESREGYFLCSFTNFIQYTSISFIVGEFVCSITLPKNVELKIDVEKMKNNIMKLLSIKTSNNSLL